MLRISEPQSFAFFSSTVCSCSTHSCSSSIAQTNSISKKDPSMRLTFDFTLFPTFNFTPILLWFWGAILRQFLLLLTLNFLLFLTLELTLVLKFNLMLYSNSILRPFLLDLTLMFQCAKFTFFSSSRSKIQKLYFHEPVLTRSNDARWSLFLKLLLPLLLIDGF